MAKSFKAIAGEHTFSYTRDDLAPECLTESHCHDLHEILYVSSGEGRYIVEGAEYEMHGDSLMITKPYKYHCVEVGPSTPYERYVIFFSKKSLPSELTEVLSYAEREDEDCMFLPSGAIPDGLRTSFERIRLAESLEGECRSLFLEALLSEILVLLAATQVEKIIPAENELGARVIRYLNDNLENDMSLDHIAKRFFVSKYYLCRAFKKYNGISIHGYVTQKRILRAKALIEMGESASGAAYRVGFGDYSAFYRAYVKQIGAPPVMRKSDHQRTGIAKDDIKPKTKDKTKERREDDVSDS
jgi:AraC-like DNA-binding protein/quercetin dioxygenase-like cupin family protein